jgi:peptidoglycan hydrolase-like protein with peptidoglycan-binding domain
MRFLVVLFLLLAAPAVAQDRLALVIGNDAYSDVPVLNKAGADAKAIAAELRGQGFETIEATDQSRRDMNRRISEFTARLDPGDTAFVFFAGHGVEIDGENYLLPTDIVAPDGGESDFVKAESIALSELLDRVRATGARMTIAIIDACRNNPFETASGRGIGRTRGLGRITAPQGSFVIFSAGAGQLALDELAQSDPAKNSVFTRALLPKLKQPGLELRAMMSDLRLEVRDLARTVQHTQIPAYYDELIGDFYFTPAGLKQELPADDTQSSTVSDGMRADFELARDIGTAAALNGFLQRYDTRQDEFTYQLALQMRDGLDADPANPTERATKAEPVLPEPSETLPINTPSRDVIRDTQQALNDLGCNAGHPDGVMGPRTKRAFKSYRSASGSTLGGDDLGTAHALQELQGKNGTICNVVATAPQTTPAKTASTGGVSLAGTWKFKANCALVVNVTGTVRYTRVSATKFTGKLTDSLGQNANTEVFLNEDQLNGTDYFPGITVTWRGKLAPDGRSFTSSGSTGCAVYAWRVG